MTKELSDALADDFIDEHEEKHLDNLRKELGLTEEKFAELKESLIEHKSESQDHSTSTKPCPVCGK